MNFRQVIDVDLNAPFIVARAVLPGMIKKGHGKIINNLFHDERTWARNGIGLCGGEGRP